MNQALKRWISVADDAPNLLPNPGFEDPHPADPLRPDNWIIDASGRSSALRSARAPRVGRWALDAELHFSKHGEGAVQLVTARPVAVTPGQRLIVGGSFLRHAPRRPAADEDARASVWIAGRWLDTSAFSQSDEPDAGDARIVGSFLEFPGLNLPEAAYATRSAAIRAPADADALVLVYILAGGDAHTGTPAAITLDDLFLKPAPEKTGRGETRRSRPRDAGRHRPLRQPADDINPSRCTGDANRGPGASPEDRLTPPVALPSPPA